MRSRKKEQGFNNSAGKFLPKIRRKPSPWGESILVSGVRLDLSHICWFGIVNGKFTHAMWMCTVHLCGNISSVAQVPNLLLKLVLREKDPSRTSIKLHFHRDTSCFSRINAKEIYLNYRITRGLTLRRVCKDGSFFFFDVVSVSTSSVNNDFRTGKVHNGNGLARVICKGTVHDIWLQ